MEWKREHPLFIVVLVREVADSYSLSRIKHYSRQKEILLSFWLFDRQPV